MEGGHGRPELQKQVEHGVKYSPAYGLKLRYKMPTTFWHGWDKVFIWVKRRSL